MTTQQMLGLASLKGAVDGLVMIAKGEVRAACKGRDAGGHDYHRGFADGNLFKAVHQLRKLRNVQRHVHEYCKGAGYYER